MCKAVIVTRPGEAGQRLADTLKEHGFQPMLHPAVHLVKSDAPQIARQYLKKINDYQLVIFVSIAAVEWAFKIADLDQWPDNINVATVGQSTAQLLSSLGAKNITTPHHNMNASELLKMDAIRQLNSSHKVLLVTAPGGNSTIEDTLQNNDVHVDRIHVYQRQAIERIEPELLQLLKTNANFAVMISSKALLAAMVHSVPDIYKPDFTSKRFIVSSSIIAEYARSFGIRDITIASGPTPQQLVEAAKAARQSVS